MTYTCSADEVWEATADCITGGSTTSPYVFGDTTRIYSGEERNSRSPRKLALSADNTLDSQ